LALTFISQLILSDEAGFACSKSKLVAKKGVVHLRPFNISDKGHLDLTETYMIPVEEAPKSKLGLMAGDILFNNTNSVDWVGKSALIKADIPHAFSNHMNRVRVDQNKVIPAWFYYWLEQKRKSGFFSANCTQWVSQAAYRLSSLNNTQIDLPPLDEQQRIVDILDRAASIQRLRQAADEKLKQIIPALFVDMFGGTAQIKDRWPQMRLDEVADIGSGITKGRQIDPAEAIDVPYLRVANVQDGYLDMDEIKTITIRRTEQAKYALQNGDIVMTEGGDLDKLGRGYVWANELRYCAHQNHVFKVRPRQQLVSPYFLATYVGSPAGKDYFLRVAKRTTGIASINKTQLSALPVPVPPIELQRAFEQKLADLRSIQGLGSRSTNAALQVAASVSSAFFSAA
jgi:type I restriction enzyme S subunit